MEMIRYFTAQISAESHDPDRPRRQGLYLEALETLPDLSLHYGSYITKNQRCPNCGAITKTFEEKMTDVNIAVEMLCGAQDNAFDTAIVISADGDLTGPINAIRRRYPGEAGGRRFSAWAEVVRPTQRRKRIFQHRPECRKEQSAARAGCQT